LFVESGTLNRDRKYVPWWTALRVTVFGRGKTPKEVRLNNQPLRDWKFDEKTHSVTLSCPDAAAGWELSLQY
jgi:hypothetical protein